MKKLIISLLAVIAVFVAVNDVNAASVTMTKSYFQKETGGGGQVPIASTNLSEVVYFYDNGLIKLRTSGTVWKYQGKNMYGLQVYSFVRNEGMAMPGVAYQNLLMATNYSTFQINYVFGMMGMGCPMYQLYNYLGEGEQMANDWRNGY